MYGKKNIPWNFDSKSFDVEPINITTRRCLILIVALCNDHSDVHEEPCLGDFVAWPMP